MRWKSQAFRKYLLSTSLGQIHTKNEGKKIFDENLPLIHGVHLVNPLNQREKMALFEATNKQVEVEGFPRWPTASFDHRILGAQKQGWEKLSRRKTAICDLCYFFVTSIKIGDLQSFFLRTEKHEICAGHIHGMHPCPSWRQKPYWKEIRPLKLVSVEGFLVHWSPASRPFYNIPKWCLYRDDRSSEASQISTQNVSEIGTSCPQDFCWKRIRSNQDIQKVTAWKT